jgi:hypothetical protein
MFARAYMGRKLFFRMLLLHCYDQCSGQHPIAKAFEGAAPLRFRPTYALANPDFLNAASDTTACAVFFTESRMKLDSATKLDRKSGERGAPVQTRLNR